MISTKPLSFLLLSSSLVLGVGCSDDTNDQNNSGMTTTTSATNGSMGTTTGADTSTGTTTGGSSSTGTMTSTPTTGTSTGTMCVPQTVCDAGACGMAPDGCGGMVDCGRCECESGTFVGADTGCGPCGLGLKTCSVGTTGAATCSMGSLESYGLPADPDEAVCTARLVFVEAALMPKGDGTKANPYASYAQAMTKVNVGQVVVLSNQEEFTEALTLRNGIHVLGGYNRLNDQWFRDKALKTKISVPWVPGEDQVGVRAKDLSDLTRLEGIELVMADAPAQPAQRAFHSVGVMAQDTKDLHIKDSSITSGRPAAGLDGSPGAPGIEGTKGADGSNGYLCFDIMLNQSTPRPQGGSGGVQPGCDAAGGAGGASGGFSSSLTNPTLGRLLPSEAGKDGRNVRGGQGGNRSTQSNIPAPDGLDGLNGPMATPGVAGRAKGAWEKQGEALVWVYEGDGADGEDGNAGGGGGGGGGQDFIYWNGSRGQEYSWGPTGAGGGAGGCGGGGGGGGKAGGSSFGIVLYDATLTLAATKVQAALGGLGGVGSTGGGGGRGGVGGTPGKHTTFRPGPGDMPQIAPAIVMAQGGTGGDGGRGSAGAGGAGGAGGASVAVYCASPLSQVIQDGASELLTDGAATGGSSLDGGGFGPEGISKQSEGCQ